MDTLDTLIINNVDFDLLEKQRKALSTISGGTYIWGELTFDQQAAIDGIQAMLDAWSDERATREEDE